MEFPNLLFPNGVLEDDSVDFPAVIKFFAENHSAVITKPISRKFFLPLFFIFRRGLVVHFLQPIAWTQMWIHCLEQLKTKKDSSWRVHMVNFLKLFFNKKFITYSGQLY